MAIILVNQVHPPVISGTEEADFIDFTAVTGDITIAGGLGNDTYSGVADLPGIELLETASGGIDTLLFESAIDQMQLPENIEHLVIVDPYLSGLGVYLGNAAANSMTGTVAGELLDGAGGNDTLVGGEGNDLYRVGSAGDVVRELEHEGADTVLASLGWTLGAFLENLVLEGTGNINGGGNALDNALTGNAGNNRLDGGAGNDVIDGGGGNDTLLGGEGGDTLAGGAGVNSMDGGAGNDVLTMSGDSLRDTLTGGLGDDVFHLNGSGIATVVEAAGGGSDKVVSNRDSYTLAANVETLALDGAALSGTGNAQSNALYGNAGHNSLSGLAGNDILDGGDGDDTLAGGAGNDTMYVDAAGDVVVETANSGTDTVILDIEGAVSVSYTLGANVEHLFNLRGLYANLTGNGLNNSITGSAAAADVLRGLDGNDTLTGMSFAVSLSSPLDVLIGGAGNDIYVLGAGSDLVVESAAAGNDTVRSAFSYTLAANVENLELAGAGNINATGNAGANRLTGNAGNNVLDGGGGNDTLAGGLGNDIYIVYSAADAVSDTGGVDKVIVRGPWLALLPTGIEAVEIAGPVATALAGNTLNNVMIGNGLANSLAGAAGDDSLWGGAGSDSLAGDGGNDTLEGGTGVDVLSGGAGNDTYYVDSALDVVAEAAGAGTDHVIASVSYSLADTDGAGALGGGVERLTLAGAARNGTGNDLNNVIEGNGHANVLAGGLGNDALSGAAAADTLAGEAGNDTLDGGSGADSMTGGTGNDVYVVDQAGDVLVEAGDSLGGVADSVLASVDWTLAPGLEHLTLAGSEFDGLSGTGNAAGNSIKGHAGDNTLDGAGGNDTMEGGLGDDLYRVDSAADVVVETALAGSGNDTIESGVTYSIAGLANVENLVLTGGATINGTGNAKDNLLGGNGAANSLSGGAGNDLASGGGGNDTLDGGTGDDTLDGGAGADSLAGGAGNDVYVVDAAADVVTEAANSGADRVEIAILDFNYTLGANLEDLAILDSSGGPVRATGNALANRITVAEGANPGVTVEGGDGDDALAADGIAGDGIAYYGGTEAEGDSGIDTLDLLLEGSYTELEAYQIESIAIEVATAGAEWDLTGVVDGGSPVRLDLSGPGEFTAAGLTSATSAEFAFGLAGYGGTLTLEIADAGSTAVVVGAGTNAAVVGANLAHLDISVTGGWAALDVSGMGGSIFTLAGAGALTLDGVAAGSNLYLADFASGTLQLDAATTGALTLEIGGTQVLLALTDVDALTLDTAATGSGLPSFVRVTGSAGELVLVGAGSDFLSIENVSADLVRAGEDGGPAAFAGVLRFANYADGLEYRGGEGTDHYVSIDAAAEVLKFGAGASGIDGTLTGSLDATDSVRDGNSGDGDILYANVNGLSDPVSGALDIARVETVVLFADAGGVDLDAARITGAITIVINADGTDSFVVRNAGADVDASGSSAGVRVFLAGGAYATGGASGDQLVAGDAGFSVLDGGLGADTLEGGDGVDYFRFSSAPGAGNEDEILGFVGGADKIQLGGDFAGLVFSGGLDAGSFESNATGVAAVASGPVIVYNNVTGDLFYDADGTGGGAGTRFALLDPGGNAPALSNEDFAQLF